MKQFLINLFKIERYFYISAIGFIGKDNISYNNSWTKTEGQLNIKSIREAIIKQNNFDSLHIVNIIAISKKQYNELNE